MFIFGRSLRGGERYISFGKVAQMKNGAISLNFASLYNFAGILYKNCKLFGIKSEIFWRAQDIPPLCFPPPLSTLFNGNINLCVLFAMGEWT